ncbi:type II secretion system F family protein [Saccharospirillum mangrovi]|uniref:type II secretion system F family protein n=1 Tax=Saccharospirillum mangrovi TaxID=2161747 RepID=UPI000D39E86A|nr:type II secretion system F family protein [Saccharospirillum mangrovi]
MNKSPSPEIWFNFVAIDHTGLRHQGRISSSSPTLARLMLQRQGMVRVIRLYRQTSWFGFGQRSVRPADIAAFTRQLATLLKAGVPLMQAFDIIRQGLAQPRLSQLVNQLSQAVASGSTFTDALRQHPDQFSALYVALIDAGERSGSLDVMLERVAVHLEKSERIRQQIRGALTYPILVLAVAGIVTAILLLKVVPTFAEMFASFGASLPTATALVIQLSQQLQAKGPMLFGGLVMVSVLLRFQLRRSLNWQRAWQRLQLKLPLLGPVLHQAALARYARTLSTTFAAGVPLFNALQSAAGAAGNWVYQKAITEVGKTVANGTELANAMRQHACFPALLTQLVAIGEQSGTLESMLNKAADIYESAVDQQVNSLTRLLEPMIMTVLGLLVGGLVVSMYLPIFRLGAVIG